MFRHPVSLFRSPSTDRFCSCSSANSCASVVVVCGAPLFESRLCDPSPLAQALGATGLSNLVVPILIELAKDAKWRVRVAVVEKSALMAKYLVSPADHAHPLPSTLSYRLAQCSLNVASVA